MSTHTPWKIEVKVEASSREDAVILFEQQYLWLRNNNYPMDTGHAGGGILPGDSVLRAIVSPRPKGLSQQEVDELREILATNRNRELGYYTPIAQNVENPATGA